MFQNLSSETVKRALFRAASAFLSGAVAVFAVFPILDVNEPKKLLIALGIAMFLGGIHGLQKLLSGYFKYDKE